MEQIKKCLIEECNTSAHWRDGGKRSLCPMHYGRWRKYGNPFTCKYAPDGSGCVFKGYKILTISGRQIYEHRYVMEKHLNRKLNPKEIIHHINGNGLDNRIENLIVESQSKHASDHNKIRYAHLRQPCEQCDKVYKQSSWQKKRSKHNFCSRICSSIARRIGGMNHVKKYNLSVNKSSIL